MGWIEGMEVDLYIPPSYLPTTGEQYCRRKEFMREFKQHIEPIAGKILAFLREIRNTCKDKGRCKNRPQKPSWKRKIGLTFVPFCKVCRQESTRNCYIPIMFCNVETLEEFLYWWNEYWKELNVFAEYKIPLMKRNILLKHVKDNEKNARKLAQLLLMGERPDKDKEEKDKKKIGELDLSPFRFVKV